MKKGFLVLLFFVLAISGWHGYERWQKEQQTAEHLTGSLSDIAEEVVAIPLQQPAGAAPITTARDIRKDGNDLFLISRNTLYHFDRQGKFISQVTRPEDIQVAGYVIDALRRQLIVLGNENDIHYYTYEGKLLKKKKLKSEVGEKRKVMSALLYNGKIFTTEQETRRDTKQGKTILSNHVAEYDLEFSQTGERRLVAAETGRERLAPPGYGIRLGIHPDSGRLYAYAPTTRPDLLLRDSLYLVNHTEETMENNAETVLAYPLRMGSRYWIASCPDPFSQGENYTFCFDSMRNEAWNLKDGFEDDFYATGKIARLAPMDAENKTYTFCQSGEAVRKAFPNQAESANAVVFIVKLKA